MLKVALIGAGMMGRNHARVLLNLPGVVLTAVIDPAPQQSQHLFSYDLYKELKDLHSSNVDYAVISTPTSSHFDIASELIQKGIPFLIEKPISADSLTAQKLVEEANKLGLKCGVGHIERFNAAAQEAKKRLSENQLGKIYQVTTIRQGPFPQRISDVGVTLDLASHDIDLTSWLLESRYKKIFAHLGSFTERSTEDLINVTGCLESGVLINHQVNWLSPLKTRSVNILGERGALQIDTLNSSLQFFENGKIQVLQDNLKHFSGVTEGQVTKYAFEKPEPLYTEHRKYRDFILGNEERFISLEDGLQTVKVAEAILQSATSGEPVDL